MELLRIWELTFIAFRNGSVETIKKIIGYINDAKLDPKTGQYLSKHTHFVGIFERALLISIYHQRS